MPYISCKHLIFDLDGTLIDSAPSILACFGKVLEEVGVQPRVPLGEHLIGPPLAKTLQTLTGIADEVAIATMTESFKKYYDTEGYLDTMPYAGVAEALSELKAAGHVLALATNKRILPTRLILGHLGWEALFASASALDSFQPRMADKAELLGKILRMHGAVPAESAYIGDKAEDGWAAEANGMHFVAARWGYGEFVDTPAHWRHLDTPGGLNALFERMED